MNLTHLPDSMSVKSKRLSKVYVRTRRGGVEVGDILYSKGGSVGPRRQVNVQLVILHTGSFTLTLDEETIQVSPGYAVLLQPGHREHFHFARDQTTRHSWIAIDPSVFPTELQMQLRRVRGPLPFLGRMATLLDEIRRSAQDPCSDSDVLQVQAFEALALAVVWAFAAAIEARQGALRSDTSALWRMDRYVSEELARPLGLSELSRAAGVSRQHLLKLCRIAGRLTPMEELYRRRLDVASDLLLHTGFSVGEIADRTGFKNQFHLSRRFKKLTGKSPLEWRGHKWKRP